MSIVEPPKTTNMELPGLDGLPPKPPRRNWFMRIALALLLLIVIAETAIIIEQKRVTQRIEAQSEAALGRFMKSGHTASTANGTDILFRNVRFCWSPQVCINTRELTATAQPVNRSHLVVFDDLNSFIVNVHNATVQISPKTLEGMFNESVFNYPGSKLRNLTVEIQKVNGENHIKLAGSLNFIFWIPFAMDTNLSVDHKNNLLVISVNSLKVFGIIPTTWFIHLKPFNLDKLLTLPQNKHLTVSHNLMMVKPFGLFPPPHIDGKMADIKILNDQIQLDFAGKDPIFSHVPQASVSNYIYLQHGSDQFGGIRLLDSKVQVIDRDPSSWFQFSLLNYLDLLPQSQVKLLADSGAVLNMPDNTHIPTLSQMNNKGGRDSAEEAALKSGESDYPDTFWGRMKFRFHTWFGI